LRGLGRVQHRRGHRFGGQPVVLESSALNTGLNIDLADTPADHAEKVRRLAAVAAYLANSGFVAVVAAASPSSAEREKARQIAGKRFYKVHVAATTGIESYEAPSAPDLVIDTQRHDIETNSLEVERLLETAGVIKSDARPEGGEFAI